MSYSMEAPTLEEVLALRKSYGWWTSPVYKPTYARFSDSIPIPSGAEYATLSPVLIAQQYVGQQSALMLVTFKVQVPVGQSGYGIIVITDSQIPGVTAGYSYGLTNQNILNPEQIVYEAYGGGVAPAAGTYQVLQNNLSILAYINPNTTGYDKYQVELLLNAPFMNDVLIERGITAAISNGQASTVYVNADITIQWQVEQVG